MKTLKVIGLMSGTSLDGVDAAIVETDGVSVSRRGPSLGVAYDPDLRKRARTLLDRAGEVLDDDAALRKVERDMTRLHVRAVKALMAREEGVDLIGFHGQTIFHAPKRKRTWQIGDATLLSRETGLPVMHDFRSADVAAGGEGAPLAPWYHAALLSGHDGPVAVLNLGGVANVTFIGGDGGIVACDTGPGNALLDDWAFRHTGVPCDLDGALARRGRVERVVLQRLLSDPYFQRAAPKSLDRLSFYDAMNAIAGLTPEDGAATLVAFTVGAVARTVLPARPRRWFVCGGGRRNPVMMEQLEAALGVSVVPVESLGWDGDALEAECFAFLAVRSLRGLPLSAPAITGAPACLSGGRLTMAALRPPRWLVEARSS